MCVQPHVCRCVQPCARRKLHAIRLGVHDVVSRLTVSAGLEEERLEVFPAALGYHAAKLDPDDDRLALVRLKRWWYARGQQTVSTRSATSQQRVSKPPATSQQPASAVHPGPCGSAPSRHSAVCYALFGLTVKSSMATCTFSAPYSTSPWRATLQRIRTCTWGCSCATHHGGLHAAAETQRLNASRGEEGSGEWRRVGWGGEGAVCNAYITAAGQQ